MFFTGTIYTGQFLFTIQGLTPFHDNTEHLSDMIELAERRLAQDNYPEYYDGIHNKLVGKEARRGDRPGRLPATSSPKPC
jgi:Alkaline and neutral invertase